MAKKSKKRPAKRKKPAKSTTKVVRVRPAKTEADQLRILIAFSERNISGKSPGMDAFFTAQVERLALQLHDLEK